MAHTWIRLDTNYPTHEKVMALTSIGKHRAVLVHVCAMAYSGGHDTDGFIARTCLPLIHGRETDMNALVEVGLMEPADGGWKIRNWTKRQRKSASDKANCTRWHGADCGCWKESE